MLPLPATVWLLGAVVLFAIASLGMFWAPATALLSESSESKGLDQGFAFGLMNLAWAAGQVVGGAGGGSLADATADAVPYALLSVLCAATLAIAMRQRRLTRAEGRSAVSA